MKRDQRIAIVGAGMAGLTCARELVKHGLNPVVFDKGRGLGGRLSTRRTDGAFQFDHGAPYLSAKTGGFSSLMEQAEAAGAVARWTREGQDPAFVGTPGMTGLVKWLADGVEVRNGLRITSIEDASGAWRLDWDGGSETFNRVVVTAPAPQTAALLPVGHPIAGSLEAVGMDPCLALMFACSANEVPSFDIRHDRGGPIPWIAHDSAKPGRPNTRCFVAHASADWSLQHLEMELEEIASLMLPLVSQAIGIKLTTDLPYVAAHRWRYALVSAPLGQPYIADKKRTLFAGGDWCLGPAAEDAWTSGSAIADALLDTR